MKELNMQEIERVGGGFRENRDSLDSLLNILNIVCFWSAREIWFMKVIKLFEMEKVAGGLILSKPVYGISPSLPVKSIPLWEDGDGMYPLPPIRQEVM